jgi:hypothetical protein
LFSKKDFLIPLAVILAFLSSDTNSEYILLLRSQAAWSPRPPGGRAHGNTIATCHLDTACKYHCSKSHTSVISTVTKLRTWRKLILFKRNWRLTFLTSDRSSLIMCTDFIVGLLSAVLITLVTCLGPLSVCSFWDDNHFAAIHRKWNLQSVCTDWNLTRFLHSAYPLCNTLPWFFFGRQYLIDFSHHQSLLHVELQVSVISDIFVLIAEVQHQFLVRLPWQTNFLVKRLQTWWQHLLLDLQMLWC